MGFFNSLTQFFFIIGLLLIILSLHRYYVLQIIKGTPTSPISLVSPGFVEIKGRAHGVKSIQAPISRVDCVYWQVTGEYYNDIHPFWGLKREKVHFNTSGIPFFVQDDTGAIRIIPDGAKITLKPDLIFEGYAEEGGVLVRHGITIDARVIQYLNSLEDKTRKKIISHFSKKMRFTEYHIHEGDALYILGTAVRIRSEATAGSPETLMMMKERKKTLYITDASEEELIERYSPGIKKDILIGLIFSTVSLFVISSYYFIGKMEKIQAVLVLLLMMIIIYVYCRMYNKY